MVEYLFWFEVPPKIKGYKHNLLWFHRGRSPQPPAEEEEEDFDDTLAAIDTCKPLNNHTYYCCWNWYEQVLMHHWILSGTTDKAL